MYTAHTNPSTCSIESDCPSLHNLTNCDPGDPSSLMTVLETEGYTDIKYIGGGYFTFNSLTAPSQPATVNSYTEEDNDMTNAIVTYYILTNTADIKVYGESPIPLLDFTAVNIDNADDVEEALAGKGIKLGSLISGSHFTANYKVS